MNYTNLVKDKRDNLRRLMDDFTSFSWRGDDAFETFGAFIVGGKDALKFYNGPSFSNQYAKPQFESANSLLTGVTFQTQKIDFTVGVYWFTIDEYRQFIHWLHPYEVNELVFHHAPKWRYMVKLAKIGDSTRYVLGKDSDGEYRYYTEIKISFEIQGASCLYATTPYQIDWEMNNGYQGGYQIIGKFNEDSDFAVSDLNTPIDFSTRLLPIASLKEGEMYPIKTLKPANELYPGAVLTSNGTNYTIALDAILPLTSAANTTMTLFKITLQHLSEGTTILYDADNNKIGEIYYNNSFTVINLRYMSESGILLIQLGDSTEKLLTLQTSTMTGQRLCQTLNINKFFLPGQLEFPEINSTFKDIQFKLTTSNNIKPVVFTQGNTQIYDINLEAYARTNVI